MNTGASWPSLDEAKSRVLEIQTKLHCWAGDDEGRRFDDLFNLVCDPAFLVVAWNRVRTNRGARTAGVDGETAHYVEARRGVEVFLDGLRSNVKGRTFEPQPVRERMIPKPTSWGSAALAQPDADIGDIKAMSARTVDTELIGRLAVGSYLQKRQDVILQAQPAPARPTSPAP